MTILNTLLVVLVSALLSCGQNSKVDQSCGENPGKDTLIVFVGEKIDVKFQPQKDYSFDGEYLATYKILEKVCGQFEGDTIKFLAYVHNGSPEFANYKTVLLYLIKDEGVYYHRKYQYNNLYKTKEGIWAGPYNRFNSDNDSIDASLKPVKINFNEEVSFDVTGKKKQYIREWYPEPYYRIENNKAIAAYGNYVPELFELKKRGHLRDLFGSDSSDSEDLVPKNIRLSKIENLKISKTDSRQLKETWKKFVSGIIDKEEHKIKSISLDSVTCSVCEGFSEPHYYNDLEPIDSLIVSSYRNLPGTELWKQIKSGKFDVSIRNQYSYNPDSKLTFYEVKFLTIEKFDFSAYEVDHIFEFVKVNDQFIFKGMRSEGHQTFD